MNPVYLKKIKSRISACKFQSDDHWSWAVFIDGLPFVTGLGKNEIPYYKKRAIELLGRSCTNV